MLPLRNLMDHCLFLSIILLAGCAPGSNAVPSRGGENRLRRISEPHIFQGKSADIENFPFTVSIENWKIHSCAGAIISENWVVTTAHCIDRNYAGNWWAKSIRAGSTTEIPFFGWGGSIHQIDDTKIYPGFDPSTFDYNVGLIKVSKKFVDGPRVKAIPLPNESEEAFVDYGVPATTVGWGSTKPGGWFNSWWLQSVTISLVPRQKCVELHYDASGRSPVNSRALCAAQAGQGGPSYGDDGGPLIHKKHLIGLVSFGGKGQNNELPTIFTNVLNEEIRSFIKSYSHV